MRAVTCYVPCVRVKAVTCYSLGVHTDQKCAECGEAIYSGYEDGYLRPDQLYCSSACRQKVYRARGRHGLSLQLDADTDNALRAVADAAGVSRQAVVLDLLKRWVDQATEP